MKLPRRLAASLLVSAGLLAPLAVHAHPGHDHVDPVWDLSAAHLFAHPVATALGIAVLGAGAWAVRRMARGSAKPAGARVARR